MAETYLGEVRDGVVVFDGTPPALPTGTRVRIQPVERDIALAELSQILLEFAGTAKGLPADMAEQHDHYIHGTPKR